LTKAMGIKWTAGGSSDGILLNYPETLPADLDGSVSDFFKIGDFKRTSALNATVEALISEGKARVLAQPKLVVKSGEEASFLVGGEIPITTTTTTAAGTNQNVEFKEYGVGVTLNPTVKQDKIDIKFNLEISNPDPTQGSNGNTAFTTTSSNTRLLLNNGQTII